MPAAALPRFAARLRHATWMEQVQLSYLIFTGAVLLSFVLPGAARQALRPLSLCGALLPLVAKDLAHWPDVAARLRAVAAVRAWRALPQALLHPEHLGLLRLDRALRRGFLGWLLRRPATDTPAGPSFTFLERGAYRTACALVLFSVLVEMPLDAAIVPLLFADAGQRTTIHLLMLSGALSTIVYTLGDRWLIGAGRHVLTEQGLELRIGARTRGTVALDAVAGCERIDGPVADWLRRRGIDRRHAVVASPLPFDRPNAVLILKEDNGVRLTHLGVERAGLACVFLYLDRPQDLIRALAARSGDRLIC